MKFFYRIMAVIMGSIIGSAFMLAIYGINSRFLESTPESPVTWLSLVFMICIGSLISNLLVGVFLSLSDKNKYCKKQQMIKQVFLFNMFLFLVTFPAYILYENIQIVGIYHLVLSICFSSIIYETFSNNGEYTMTGIYGGSFGLFFILMVLNYFEIYNGIIIFFIPVFIWLFITIFTITIEYLYTVIFNMIKVPFLDPNLKKD